jgi:hypothetical protein
MAAASIVATPELGYRVVQMVVARPIMQPSA